MKLEVGNSLPFKFSELSFGLKLGLRVLGGAQLQKTLEGFDGFFFATLELMDCSQAEICFGKFGVVFQSCVELLDSFVHPPYLDVGRSQEIMHLGVSWFDIQSRLELAHRFAQLPLLIVDHAQVGVGVGVVVVQAQDRFELLK